MDWTDIHKLSSSTSATFKLVSDFLADDITLFTGRMLLMKVTLILAGEADLFCTFIGVEVKDKCIAK